MSAPIQGSQPQVVKTAEKQTFTVGVAADKSASAKNVKPVAHKVVLPAVHTKDSIQTWNSGLGTYI